MGTKVQYNLTRDFIEDANGCWPPFYEARHTGYPYNSSILKSDISYSESDREMLKRTMLEHESTFRKQVYELHRLYSIQKNLMNEVGRNEFPRSIDSAKAQPYSSKLQCDDNKRMKQQQLFWPVGTSNSGITIPNEGMGLFKAPVNVLEKNHQLSYTGNMKHNKYSEIDFQCSSKIRFDLELPAESYIIEENREERNGRASCETLISHSSCNLFPLQPENDLKLSLGKVEEHYALTQNHLFHRTLADLNEPIGEIEGSSTSQNVPPRSLPRLENGDKQRDSCTNILNEELNNARNELLLFRNESGKSIGGANSLNPQFCYEKIPSSSEAASPLRVNKDHEILYPSHSKDSGFTKSTKSTRCFPTTRQQLPCFNVHNTVDLGDDYRTSSTSISEVTSYPNGISNGFLLAPPKHDVIGTGATSHESKICCNNSQRGDNKSMKDFDLNQALTDSNQLKGSASEMSSGFSNRHCQLLPSFPRKSSPRIELDLNRAVACEEYTEQQVSPHEEKKSSKLHVDLEAQVSEQVARNVLLRGNSYIGRTESSDFVECSDEGLIREAAENIVAMSLVKQTCLEDNESSPVDGLNWFADLVVNSEFAKTDNSSPRILGEIQELYDDELDSFEYMTLKLVETKVDEHFVPQITPAQEIEKGGDKSAASLLLTLPRRGQAKKRRPRRKDFQKDILPGLVTLSRHEVTEDLQTIEALVRATGKSWQTDSVRRNKGRRNQQTRVKATKRRRCPSTNGSDVHDNPHPAPQAVTTECKIDGSIVGWGRTRRCRRQRCPPSSVHLPTLRA